jgi:hypothetical protein
MTLVTFSVAGVAVLMKVYGPDWEGDDALYRDIRDHVVDGVRIDTEEWDACCT